MIKKLVVFVFVVGVLGFGINNLNAQGKDASKADELLTIPAVPVDYEASPAYPFGRLNPKAPPETKQLAFLIGEFDCVDRIFSGRDKKWYKMNVVRKAEYVLDGFAIQDKNWTPLLNSSNIRAFDPKKKNWQITYFKTAPYFSGVWEGGREGEDMVFRLKTGNRISRLTYFNIGKNSYSWKSESVVDGKATISWQFSCQRRR